MRLNIFANMVVVASTLLSGCAIANPPSSHDARDLTDLLSNKVWVFNFKPSQTADYKERMRAAYFADDGTTSLCWYDKDTYSSLTGVWKVERNEKYRSLIGLGIGRPLNDDKTGRGWTPINYSATTGRLFDQAWWNGSWHVFKDGWVQATWPRAMKDACPDLPLPTTLLVNEKQTSTIPDELRSQDLEAPIKGYRGKYPTTQPKTTGMTRDELLQTLSVNETNVWTSDRGAKFVINLRDHGGGQLWAIGDDYKVYDIGNFHYTDDETALAITWQGSGEKMTYTFGDRFPFTPTNQPYPAFSFAEWLVEQQDEVVLTFNGKPTAFLFLEEGKLVAEDSGTPAKPINGTWWLENGRLLLSLPGLGITHTTWQQAAREANWSQHTEVSRQ